MCQPYTGQTGFNLIPCIINGEGPPTICTMSNTIPCLYVLDPRLFEDCRDLNKHPLTDRERQDAEQCLKDTGYTDTEHIYKCIDPNMPCTEYLKDPKTTTKLFKDLIIPSLKALRFRLWHVMSRTR